MRADTALASISRPARAAAARRGQYRITQELAREDEVRLFRPDDVRRLLGDVIRPTAPVAEAGASSDLRRERDLIARPDVDLSVWPERPARDVHDDPPSSSSPPGHRLEVPAAPTQSVAEIRTTATESGTFERTFAMIRFRRRERFSKEAAVLVRDARC